VTRKAVNLIAILVVSVYILSWPAIVHANPIVVYEIQGKVHVMENGLPSDKVDSVELVCEYSIFTAVLVVEEDGTTQAEGQDIPKTSTNSWPCQHGECPFDTMLQTGGGPVRCKWVVNTPSGSTMNYQWTPRGVEFKDVYLDIATGIITVNPIPPATSTPAPTATSPKGLQVLPNLDTFLAALILAWLVEVPTIFLMLRYVFRPGYEDTKRLLGVGLLATLVTLPVAWYALPFIQLVLTLTPWVYIALVETMVVAVEAWIFARLLRIPMWKAALVSLLANGLSFMVGLAVL